MFYAYFRTDSSSLVILRPIRPVTLNKTAHNIVGGEFRGSE